MPVVDTHCHAGPNWFEPEELLLFQMNRNGVDMAVLVQYGGNFALNSYTLDCVRRHPTRFCAVALVDAARTDAPAELERWAKAGTVGVRLRPETRSPGRDPLAIWRMADELGLAVSLLGALEAFASDEFYTLAQSFPSLKLVVEHLASVGAGAKSPYDTYRKALALAKLPNTYIKIPGLGEICPRPVPFTEPVFKDVPPLIKMAYESFGPKRMMWGSDYPPVSGREGYANALNWTREHLAAFASHDDREWIMGKTALSVFKF